MGKPQATVTMRAQPRPRAGVAGAEAASLRAARFRLRVFLGKPQLGAPVVPSQALQEQVGAGSERKLGL